jgi:hypothetical protein
MHMLWRAEEGVGPPIVNLRLGRIESMTRVQLGVPEKQLTADAAWHGTSARNPCPVCGGSRGCFVHEEDGFACCGTSPSDWPLTNGTWLHRFVGAQPSMAEQASSKSCVTYLMGPGEPVGKSS